jgi:hypothetical protein
VAVVEKIRASPCRSGHRGAAPVGFVHRRLHRLSNDIGHLTGDGFG